MPASRPTNPLALAVLALLFERPMHPYEMAVTLKDRHKHESIKLRYGSLYTVIDALAGRALIAAKETGREGRRPERTVYVLTQAGLDELRQWMRDLLRAPAKEYPQFEAALSLIPVLPPEEAVPLLRERALQLNGTIWRMEAQLAELAQQDLSAIAGGQLLPPELAGQKFPPLFTLESEYHLAMVRAEFDFVTELVRRITEEGWGPVDAWRAVQAACARQHAPGGGEPSSSTRTKPVAKRRTR
ncbi:MAG TPA: helix-turn-helix transcriptional regulator [Pseudolabrys sp.]|nr:helix-turn-helix transcriptional regulator [Pseudolabrys sp.]